MSMSLIFIAADEQVKLTVASHIADRADAAIELGDAAARAL